MGKKSTPHKQRSAAPEQMQASNFASPIRYNTHSSANPTNILKIDGHPQTKSLAEKTNRNARRRFMDATTAEEIGVKHAEAMKADLRDASPEEREAAVQAFGRTIMDDPHFTLLSVTAPERQTWVDRVQATPRREMQPLPKAAIGSWAEDKAAGLTPPEHLKKHYAPWLRRDAQGLTFSDVKQLNPELHTDLRNWLRYRELPEDCPLLTKKERNDMWVAGVAAGELPMPTDYLELARLHTLAKDRGIALPKNHIHSL